MTKVTLQPEKELFSSGSTVRSLSTKSFGFPDHNLNVASYGYIWDNQMISPKPVKNKADTRTICLFPCREMAIAL